VAPALVAGAVGLALALPFLRDLSRANLIGGVGMELAVRRFFPLDDLFAEVGAGTAAQNIALLGVLPWNYLMELGFFGVAGVVYVLVSRPLGGEADRRCELALLAASVLVATFVRSNIRNNDLGWRGFMPAQFVLLAWSVDVLAWVWPALRRWTGDPEPPVRLRGWVRAALASCLVIGLLSTAYDLTFLRVSYPLIDRRAVNATGTNGRRHRDVRTAYEWVDRALPRDAVVQHNPLRPIDSYRGLYGNRQAIASDRLYGTMFGIPEDMYAPYLELVGAMFHQRDWEAVEGDAAALGIDYLLVKSVDPCWRDPESWVWQRIPVYANADARVFAVGSPLEHATMP
jgi:hypothetical protein